jgi:Transcriptional regulator PadR-like family
MQPKQRAGGGSCHAATTGYGGEGDRAGCSEISGRTKYLCGTPTERGAFSCGIPTGGPVGESKLDLLQGTLDLMVLQTLAVMGALHGYGIARRIEQISGNEILLNQGTIYASLMRLQQRGGFRSGALLTIIAKPSFIRLQEKVVDNLSRTPSIARGSPA